MILDKAFDRGRCRRPQSLLAVIDFMMLTAIDLMMRELSLVSQRLDSVLSRCPQSRIERADCAADESDAERDGDPLRLDFEDEVVRFRCDVKPSDTEL